MRNRKPKLETLDEAVASLERKAGGILDKLNARNAERQRELDELKSSVPYLRERAAQAKRDRAEKERRQILLADSATVAKRRRPRQGG